MDEAKASDKVMRKKLKPCFKVNQTDELVESVLFQKRLILSSKRKVQIVTMGKYDEDRVTCACCIRSIPYGYCRCFIIDGKFRNVCYDCYTQYVFLEKGYE